MGYWTPSVDLEETDDAYVVVAELAGIRRDDIDIELQDRDPASAGEFKEREHTPKPQRR